MTHILKTRTRFILKSCQALKQALVLKASFLRLSLTDVVFDPDLTGSLVQLLSKLLQRPSTEAQPLVLICSTIRNPQTYGGFKLQLGKPLCPARGAMKLTVTSRCVFVHRKGGPRPRGDERTGASRLSLRQSDSHRAADGLQVTNKGFLHKHV